MGVAVRGIFLLFSHFSQEIPPTKEGEAFRRATVPRAHKHAIYKLTSRGDETHRGVCRSAYPLPRDTVSWRSVESRLRQGIDVIRLATGMDGVRRELADWSLRSLRSEPRRDWPGLGYIAVL